MRTALPAARPSPADAFVRRLLRIPAPRPSGRSGGGAAARRAFSRSVVVSGVRCLLTYVVLPFVAPALGLAAGVGPALAIAIGSIAIVANVVTIRRFWLADHRARWAYTMISLLIIAMLVALLVIDVADLVG